MRTNVVVALVAGLLGVAAGWMARAPGAAPVAAAGTAVAAADTRTWVQRVVADCPPAPECPDRPQNVPEVVFADEGRVDVTAPLPDDAPVPWPDDLPPELQPEAMKAALRDVIEACGAEDVVDVDCSEPPCFIVYEGDFGAAGPSCPAWRERFGEEGSTSQMNGESAMCPDGTERTVSMIAPWLEELRPPKDPKDPMASLRRMKARARKYTHGAGCTEPLTLTVENVPGHELVWAPKR